MAGLAACAAFASAGPVAWACLDNAGARGGAVLAQGSATADVPSATLGSMAARLARRSGPIEDAPVRTSANVEWLGRVDEPISATGGKLVGDYFYVTGWTSFSIYDVSDPTKPKLMSRTPIGFQFENEDVDTNGDILLFSDFATDRTLYVYDVRDKQAPKLLSRLEGAGTHTTTCIDDCRYAYGSYLATGRETGKPLSGGTIVDLRDPANPRLAGEWTGGGNLPTGKVHDVTELAGGRAVAAADPMVLLDTSDPAKPKTIAKATNDGHRLHSVEWPRAGEDRFVLSTYETNANPCERDTGPGEFAVWDASKMQETGTISLVNEWYLRRGTYDDGSPAATTLGCSPHWFEAHPDFHDGGVVALGAYDHGVRFLEVKPDGAVGEIGYALPSAAETWGAYWITDDIVYAVDAARGIDIYRLK